MRPIDYKTVTVRVTYFPMEGLYGWSLWALDDQGSPTMVRDGGKDLYVFPDNAKLHGTHALRAYLAETN